MPYRHQRKLGPYERAARAGGLEPVPVLASGNVSFGNTAGLLLIGGSDVNPARYGAEARPETDQPDNERDAVEIELIDEALRRDLPILAICRGLQILNVYHGGTLIQHLASSRHDPNPELEDKAAPVHSVSIEPESRLAEIAGTQEWRVNSRHHQAAATVGVGLRVSAIDADDGTIEALERPDRSFVVAVQWHPEEQVFDYPEQLKLFRSFAEACEGG